MRKVTLYDVQRLAEEARENLWTDSHDAGYANPKIYLHWTAGHHDQTFDEYHINITGDGGIFVSTDDFSETLSHTWRRNSGSIGVALCCAYGADTSSLGNEPPTSEQIETLCQVVARLCYALWLTPNINCVLTHGEAADNEDGNTVGYSDEECYGPKTTCERWDLEYLGTQESQVFSPYCEETRGGTILRGKAIWYLNLLNNNLEGA